MKPVRAFLCALSFLTRLPVGSRAVEPGALGLSLVFFPLVGLLLGVVLLGGEQLLRGHLSSALIAVVLAAVLAWLTGGLHLDGLADTFDGLGGSRGDRERALAIMRDSRIGAFGAIAVLLLVLAKVTVIRDVLEGRETLALCAFPLVARLAAVALVVGFPCARSEGLGKAFHEQGQVAHLAFASVFAVPIVEWAGTRGALATCAALAAALAFAAFMTRRLGGITGDVCGAAIELSELAFLVVIAWR